MLNLTENISVPLHDQGTVQVGCVRFSEDERLLVDLGVAVKNQHNVWARPALSMFQAAVVGDKVLVSRDSEGKHYVTGIVEMGDGVREQRIRLRDGTQAALTREQTGDDLFQLFSKEGRPIMEYDTKTGKTRFYLSRGDVELNAEDGDLVFNAAGEIRFNSRQTINLESATGINLAAKTANNISSKLALKPGRACLSGTEISLHGRRLDLHADQVAVIGKLFKVKTEEIRLVTLRFESLCKDIIQQAHSLYSVIEGLMQTKAKRIRTVVDSNWHLKSENIVIRGVKDVKVKSDKIHLG